MRQVKKELGLRGVAEKNNGKKMGQLEKAWDKLMVLDMRKGKRDRYEVQNGAKNGRNDKANDKADDKGVKTSSSLMQTAGISASATPVDSMKRASSEMEETRTALSWEGTSKAIIDRYKALASCQEESKKHKMSNYSNSANEINAAASNLNNTEINNENQIEIYKNQLDDVKKTVYNIVLDAINTNKRSLKNISLHFPNNLDEILQWKYGSKSVLSKTSVESYGR